MHSEVLYCSSSKSESYYGTIYGGQNIKGLLLQLVFPWLALAAATVGRHTSRGPSCFIAQLAIPLPLLWPSPNPSFSRNEHTRPPLGLQNYRKERKLWRRGCEAYELSRSQHRSIWKTEARRGCGRKNDDGHLACCGQISILRCGAR